jgi:hypothetical protein
VMLAADTKRLYTRYEQLLPASAAALHAC